MTQSQAVYDKLYVNSPQFEGIVRENNSNKSKTFAPDIIPSNSINKYTVKQILDKKKSSKNFRNEFPFREPNIIYNEIVNDSRNSLMTNISVQERVNNFFVDKFESNLESLYKYSPGFFASNFYTKIAGTKSVDADKFHAYEKYIYLLALIVYVNANREKLRGELSNEAESIIAWAQLRDDSSLSWILEGPNDSYDMPKDFIERYNGLIASTNSTDAILEQQKMSKMGLMYSSIENFKYQASQRPNVFDKTLDLARQYYIIIRDETHLLTELDETNNVVFDAKYVDLGEVSKNTTVAQYNEIKVDQNTYLSPPSRISFKSLQQLFTTFNSIAVQELSFAYEVYGVDLSRYSTVYLVFPDVHTSEHTIIGEIPRGTLYIAGKFNKDTERRRLLFIPNEEMTTFDGSQTVVKSFRFYITNSLEEKNSIVGNTLTLDFNKNEIYNHLLKTNLSASAIYDANTTLNVRSDLIDFALPMSIDEMHVVQLKSFLSNLEFIPNALKELDLDSLYAQYMQLRANVSSNIDMGIHDATAESLISSSAGGTYVKMRLLDEEFRRLMEITRRMNSLFYYRKLVRSNVNPNDLYRAALRYSDNVNYQNWIKAIAAIADYDSARGFFHSLCLLRANELVDNGKMSSYLELFEKLITLVVKSFAYLPLNIEMKVDVFKGGRIDGMKFKIDSGEIETNHTLASLTSHKLTFVQDDEANENYDYMSDEENDIVTIRLFEETSHPLSTVCYSPSMKILQRLSTDIVNINQIQPIRLFNTGYVIKRSVYKDKYGYIYLSGGSETLNVDEISNVSSDVFVFANLTEFTEQIPITTLKNNDITINMIRYMPIEFIDNVIISFNIFSFISSSLVFYINTNRNLSLLTNDVKHAILAGNFIAHVGDITIEINTEMILGIRSVYASVSCDSCRIGFALDDNLLVSRIDVYFFRISDDVSLGDANSEYPYFIIDVLKYGASTRNGHEIASHIERLDDMAEEKYGPLFKDDNKYRAFRVYDNMIQKYWNNDILEASILINPLPIEVPSTNVDGLNAYSTIIANERNIIYSIDENIKTFYSVFSIIPTPAMFLLNNELTNNKHVFVRSTIERLFDSDLSEPRKITTNKITLVLKNLDENMMLLIREMELDVYLDRNAMLIYKCVLRVDGIALTIDGCFESGAYYTFNMNLASSQLHGQGALTLVYSLEDGDMYISAANVFITENALNEFYIEEGAIKRKYLFCMYRNFNSQSTKLVDSSVALNSINALSLNMDFDFKYSRIMPIFKYYQNNLKSMLYSKNGDIEMTIDKTTDFASNRKVRIQKYKMLTDDNKTDMNIAATIPYENRYVVEDINNRLIVTEVKNENVNDENAIIPDSASLTFNNNDLLYLSLNVK